MYVSMIMIAVIKSTCTIKQGCRWLQPRHFSWFSSCDITPEPRDSREVKQGNASLDELRDIWKRTRQKQHNEIEVKKRYMQMTVASNVRCSEEASARGGITRNNRQRK